MGKEFPGILLPRDRMFYRPGYEDERGLGDLAYEKLPLLQDWLFRRLRGLSDLPKKGVSAIELGSGTGTGMLALTNVLEVLGINLKHAQRIDIQRYDTDRCPQVPVLGVDLSMLKDAIGSHAKIPREIEKLRHSADLVLIVNDPNNINGMIGYFARRGGYYIGVETIYLHEYGSNDRAGRVIKM